MSSSTGGAPLTHSPANAPTVDTSPETVGVESLSPNRRNRLSQVVDKLGKSIHGSGNVSPSPSSPRRLFSIKRKNRSSIDGAASEESAASTPLGSQKLPNLSGLPSNTLDDDSSPFVQPSMARSFTGSGSMRAGTQTLIQALQAIPWSAEPDDPDESGHETGGTVDSDEEDEEDLSQPLASSIHTIYRPLARSQRYASNLKKPSVPQSIEEDEATKDPEESEKESEDEDFEANLATPRIPQGPSALGLHIQRNDLDGDSVKTPVAAPIVPSFLRLRAGSMNTVRRQRRSRLAVKLQGIFELPDLTEVVAEMPCWLLRSILLQGYMYLTNSHLCFFAHLPSREDQILKSGNLSKKASRTKRWIRHWFILKNDALSWYTSSADPYFPHGIVDLRYAVSCEAVGTKEFRLRTNQRSLTLYADSPSSRDEWVKVIRKVIFKGQNLGNSVKIAIPYSAILDVERSSAMDFSETIEVKVVEQPGTHSTDSYFFAYFHDLSTAIEQIRDAVRSARLIEDPGTSQSVLDTTSNRQGLGVSTRSDQPHDSSAPRSATSSTFRLGSLFRPFQTSTSQPQIQDEEFTHISRRSDSSFIPFTTSPIHTPQTLSEKSPPLTPGSGQDIGGNEDLLRRQSMASDHTYPPSTSSSWNQANAPSVLREASSSSTWSMGVPSWLRSGRRALGLSGSGDGVKEVYSFAHTQSSLRSQGSGGEMAFSVLETPEMIIDPEVQDKFRAAFAYDEKEKLLGYFPGHIFRLLPMAGKLFVSTNFFCFKSSGPLAVRTKMALPIREVLAVEKSKARFGNHGLIVIIKGHEELFFELWAEDRRDALVELLQKQMEDSRKRTASGDSSVPTAQEAIILEDFDPRMGDPGFEDAPGPVDPQGSMADSLPAVMFTSASSTFLTFKPPSPLHFTFLTIGSRGDVQPYIALAKGLMADGHKCRIATHLEFKEWILSHNIEYGYVGGDPAELMRICVENGMFTVSFLRETLQKFRGWLDDLLATSWEACQGTDVLVESPSAMGGYHIAEALGIPYFRAFTMTWSRTRAYPHAFAVPERKMGGGYNYMTYVMFDQVFWRAIAGQVNRWRRNVLHISSTSFDKMEPHKIPFIYNFSQHVVPPPLDWPEWIKISGYWFLDDADPSGKKWEPPEKLVAFLDNARKLKKPVVYVGFGSIVVSDPKAMTRAVIESITRSGVHAILSKGWSDRFHVKSLEASEVEEPLPDEIYPITSIPHDWLFKQIDAACHHGGAGTTGASLRAGLPTIIHPFFGDQFFWADRVEALGVGSGVRKLTVDHLSEALTLATTDMKQIERAKLLGEQIRAENGVANAIEVIYRDLEYARSNIKRPHNLPGADDDGQSSGLLQEADLPSRYVLDGSNHSSAGGSPSEDWSVISDSDRSSSDESKPADPQPPKSPRHSKRNSIASAVRHALSPHPPTTS